MEIFRQSSTTREDLGLLAVMDAIQEREQITQRELARVTGLNLKKVNYCLHKLLEKGYVKFQRVLTNPDKRAYLYILTPAGFKAKSRLTYGFLRFTLNVYGKLEEKLRRSLDEIASAGVRKVLLYGASDAARILLGIVNGERVEVVGVIDDEYDGLEFHGVPVINNAQLGDLQWEGILITDTDDLDGVEKQLESMEVPREAVWRLT